MKTILLLITVLSLTACASMTPREKQTAWIVGAVVVSGILISKDTVIHKCHGKDSCNQD